MQRLAGQRHSSQEDGMPGHKAIVFRSSPESPGGMGEIALDPSPTGRDRLAHAGLAVQDSQIVQQAYELALAGSVTRLRRISRRPSRKSWYAILSRRKVCSTPPGSACP